MVEELRESVLIIGHDKAIVPQHLLNFEFDITFSRVLDAGESNLGSLGFLHGQLAISLGITCVVVFIFIAASTQSLGKVNLSKLSQ